MYVLMYYIHDYWLGNCNKRYKWLISIT